jgi:hypothetical protein
VTEVLHHGVIEDDLNVEGNVLQDIEAPKRVFFHKRGRWHKVGLAGIVVDKKAGERAMTFPDFLRGGNIDAGAQKVFAAFGFHGFFFQFWGVEPVFWSEAAASSMAWIRASWASSSLVAASTLLVQHPFCNFPEH